MEIPISNLIRVETVKLIKRKDWLSIAGIIGTGILFSASILTDSYVGAEQQSCLYWCTTQMLNSDILLIMPLILAYGGVRIMSQEIENGSFELFDQRVGERERLYLAKSVALWIYATLIYFASIMIHMIIYYMIVCKNKKYASGTVLGENTAILACVLIAIYLSTFILLPQIVLFFGTFCKPGSCIGILFVLVLLSHYIYKLPLVGLISPWKYIINLANDVVNTTNYIYMKPAYMLQNVLAQTGLCGIGSVISIYYGRMILRKRDL